MDNKENYKNLTGTQLINFKDDLSAKSDFEERYTKREQIGAGGQAVVYRVWDTHLKTYRCMKIMKPHFETNKTFIKHFEREINITNHLNFPNIVKVYDAGTEKNRLFIIMDYVNGTDLNDKGKLPSSIAALVTYKVAEALDYAHNAAIEYDSHAIKGIIHRDIKPSNLMIEKSGEVMVMDFGLSKAITNLNQTITGQIFGSLPYISPEQSDNGELDQRSDIYSLGITLYQLLTGKTNFENNSPTEIIKKKASKNFGDLIDKGKIDPILYKIICKATKLDKNERYQTCEEFMGDLKNYLDNNFDINSKYKNLIGAYFNYGITPHSTQNITKTPYKQKKKGSNKKPKIISGPKGTNFFNKKKYKYAILAFIVVLLAGTLFKIFYKPAEVIPIKTKYGFTIKNPQKLEGDVYINNRKEGILNENRTVNFPIEKSGTYRVLIKNENRDDLEVTEYFTEEDSIKTITYDPNIYELTIINPYNKDGDIYWKGNKIKKLDNKRAVKIDFLKKGKYEISIKNKLMKQEDYIVAFTDKERDESISYKPTPEPVIEPTLPPEEPAPPEPEPQIKQYTLRIKNPQGLDAKLYIEGSYQDVDFYKKELVTVSIDEKGGTKISIKHGTSFRRYERTFSPQNPTWTITYNPLVYDFKIINKNNINASVYFDGEVQGKLIEKSNYEFDKPKNFTLIIKTQYPIQTKTEEISLTETNRSESVIYDPPTDIFQITITNPKGISADILVNNTETYPLKKTFNKKYKNDFERRYKITAKGYEDTTFVARFSQKLDWEFEYNPKPVIVSLIIKSTLAGGEIEINGETLPFSTEKGETIINDLKFGDNCKIRITNYPQYKVFTKELILDSLQKHVTYIAIPEVSTLQFVPELDEILLKNTSIQIDGNYIPTKSTITDIPVGKHDIRLFFSLCDYHQTVFLTVETEPLGINESITKVYLGVDLVTVKCNVRNSEVFVDGKKAGKSPIIIPYIKKTLSLIKIRPRERNIQEKTIDPHETHIVTFTYKDPEAEKFYNKAQSYLSEYRASGGVETTLLSQAQTNLEQAIGIDNSYSAAYSLLIYVLTELLLDDISNDNQIVAEHTLDRIFNMKEDALEYLPTSVERAAVCKNIGKGQFEFAFHFFTGQEQANFLRTNCLLELTKSQEYRGNMTDLEEVSLSLRNKYDLDEADCYLAMSYQRLYEITNDKIYKTKAERMWNLNPFVDFVKPNTNKTIHNPFKDKKKEWKSRLLN